MKREITLKEIIAQLAPGRHHRHGNHQAGTESCGLCFPAAIRATANCGDETAQGGGVKSRKSAFQTCGLLSPLQPHSNYCVPGGRKGKEPQPPWLLYCANSRLKVTKRKGWAGFGDGLINQPYQSFFAETIFSTRDFNEGGSPWPLQVCSYR